MQLHKFPLHNCAKDHCSFLCTNEQRYHLLNAGTFQLRKQTDPAVTQVIPVCICAVVAVRNCAKEPTFFFEIKSVWCCAGLALNCPKSSQQHPELMGSGINKSGLSAQMRKGTSPQCVKCEIRRLNVETAAFFTCWSRKCCFGTVWLLRWGGGKWEGTGSRRWLLSAAEWVVTTTADEDSAVAPIMAECERGPPTLVGESTQNFLLCFVECHCHLLFLDICVQRLPHLQSHRETYFICLTVTQLLLFPCRR